MGSLTFLQWIFPTQESNQGLLHCRQILYQLSYEGNPLIRMATIKKKKREREREREREKITNVGKDVEKLGPLCSVG